MSALLEFRSVSKWYGPVLGVSDVSFAVDGGVVGLLGQNGAGKSTVLKLAAGLIDAGIGTVTVIGEPPRHSLASIGSWVGSARKGSSTRMSPKDSIGFLAERPPA